MSPLGSTCSGVQYDPQRMQDNGQLKTILGICALHALLLATYVMHSGTFLNLDQLYYIYSSCMVSCMGCLSPG